MAFTSMTTLEARRYIFTGKVQGVGFRPFVYRLALRFQLVGSVQNLLGQVQIEAQGSPSQLDDFIAALMLEKPPLAQPVLAQTEKIPALDRHGFEILPSASRAAAVIHIPPDEALCDDCRRELLTPTDRRYRYPFINCTQCGPRYTLIRRLPYDRARTTMADLPLCPACRAEYENPLDRRFHAEPVACPVCGPQLFWSAAGQHSSGESALAAAIDALRAGEIVAVKGIGGYHLLCDAENEAAVLRLRVRKNRPHKPLALMFPNLADIQSQLHVEPLARQLLTSPARPIVILPRRPSATLPKAIAPGLQEIGAMLPYSPLHELLLNQLGRAVVATSANLSGEPVLTDNAEVERRLASVADGFLHHDRPIARPADDSVLRVVAGKSRLLRVGRGVAPLEIELPFAVSRPTLAVGGQTKNTVALAWGKRAVLSPHIGDLSSPRSIAIFEQTIAELQALYQVQAEGIVCDAHPQYASSRWAATQNLPLHKVSHHQAHAAALAGECAPEKRWLTFTWDGVGLGEDGELWGGEALLGEIGDWRRVATLRSFKLPGGERAAREVWRSAAGLCWELGLDYTPPLPDKELLKNASQRDLNSPRTSAVGRLFDGVAHLLGLLETASYEGQAGMLLEQVAAGNVTPIDLPISVNAAGLRVVDWQPLLLAMRDEQHSVAYRAQQFHHSLAQSIVAQARHIQTQHSFERVGLTGGVFQNKLLTELTLAALAAAGFEAALPAQVPCNDGGLALGQLIEVSRI